ncbi:MAG TPA: mechanosensitive ion channel protein MscS [Flavobacteriales bacterium]|nr:mechanosensitive ion channel protein MscS [Flavobacteriales bacterium]
MDFLKSINTDPKIIAFVIVIGLGAYILIRIIKWFINKQLIGNADPTKDDITRYNFFKNGISFIIWMLAIGAVISVIPSLKTLAITLFAGAGILMAILGFAAQEAFSNIISGVFIVLFKPFRVGDMIKVSNLDYGIVVDITLRHTVINNFENKRLIVPNSVIGSEVIVNDSIDDSKICRFIEIGISYDSDIDLATKIIQEEAMKHKGCIDARTSSEKKAGKPQVNVRLMSFGDFSINLRAYVWTKDPFEAPQMHADLNRAIKKRFDLEGIEIPFPYRTVVFKKDLPPNSNSLSDE